MSMSMLVPYILKTKLMIDFFCLLRLCFQIKLFPIPPGAETRYDRLITEVMAPPHD